MGCLYSVMTMGWVVFHALEFPSFFWMALASDGWWCSVHYLVVVVVVVVIVDGSDR